MITVNAKEICEGMEVKTWFGTHTLLRIDPYMGKREDILNELVFSNGYRLMNYKSNIYRLKRDSIPPIPPIMKISG